jgi:hypothetical protein
MSGRGSPGRSRRWRLLLAPAIGAAVICQLSLPSTPAAASATTAAQVASPGAVSPNSSNDLDCNGWSKEYGSARAAHGELCTDPVSVYNGKAYPYYDNGHYIGHDEPSVKFISSEPGSGNNFSYLLRLPSDPSQTPTVSSDAVTDYAELSPAPWFGMAICDPDSYPENPCTPDSDTNSGEINNPNDAGSAFLELQFYPPGYGPFVDAPSCDPTHWCVALTIDSLESYFNFAGLNPNCEEPVNFAFLQRNGVPAGPPSPQLTDANTFTPNSQTLLLNQGDTVTLNIHDTPNGLIASVHDISTGQTGYMVASAKNGFMNTNVTTCDGTPFNFHPEYSTAEQQNQVPWAALEGGILMEQEEGHFEPCNSISNSLPFVDDYADGTSITDLTSAQTCDGGFEGPNAVGEGPCDPTSGVCTVVTTEEGTTCPNDNFLDGSHCEYSDALCLPAGARTVTNVLSTPSGLETENQTWDWPIAGCQANYFQNGDLDFDGPSYYPDWPDGSPNHPTAFEYLGPFTDGLHLYPQIQFESDIPASENACNTSTGAGCTVPPAGAAFYPFWTLGVGSLGCEWEFGNVIPHHTVLSFGGDAEYGTSDVARFGGTNISPVESNPMTRGCL